MERASRSFLLVNFGGPRTLDEIPSFLCSLLCDQDVIRTPFPPLLHNWLFRRVARKRASKVREDYKEIGGRSPIYFDTETLKEILTQRLKAPVYTFHRYLPTTHAASLDQISKEKELIVLPLFPQFCYATTGSIARFLSRHFPTQLRWIRSYAGHPAFITSYQKRIAFFLQQNHLTEEETILLFSAHGVPKLFSDEGDPYESECNLSFKEVMKGFPKAKGRLCYQSKFGKGEWLTPSTDEASREVLRWCEGRIQIVFVPISFTSDHIETLFEIEKLYLPIIRAKGLNAYRCPALNVEPYWIDSLVEILQAPHLHDSNSLIFNKLR